VGIVGSLPEVEAWLSEVADSWRPLSDPEYRYLVRDWKAKFSPLIEQSRFASSGDRALDALAAHLPADMVIFSGVHVPEVANLGGSCACAYSALALASLNHDLLRRNELITCAPDLLWSCLFSHETGGMFREQLYGRLESAA
jgi:hypothetical protein